MFVTPLQRTAITAAPLAQAKGLESTVIEDLAEVRLGDWEGGEYRIREASGDPIVKRALRGGALGHHPRRRVGRVVRGPACAPGSRRSWPPPARTPWPWPWSTEARASARLAARRRSRAFAFVHSDNGSLSGSWWEPTAAGCCAASTTSRTCHERAPRSPRRLFDWDGTLIDSRAALLAAWHEPSERVLGRRYPVTPEEEDVVFTLPGKEIWPTLVSGEAQLAELASEFQGAYDRNAELVRAFPGVRELAR